MRFLFRSAGSDRYYLVGTVESQTSNVRDVGRGELTFYTLMVKTPARCLQERTPYLQSLAQIP